MVRFTTKKVASLTLGEKLKKLRDERRMTITEVSKHTQIQVKYLQYIEDGNYAKLPADVYVKGFLRSYANYIGINEASLIKQYEREKGIQRSIKKQQPEEKKKNENMNQGFIITPKVTIASAVILIVVSSFFYLYSQVDSFISTPRLIILNPSDGSSINSASVHVSGIAEKDAIVTINDQAVLVNEKGEFSEDLSISEGLNTITVKAKNKFDKETVKSVSISAHSENENSENSENQNINQEENNQNLN